MLQLQCVLGAIKPLPVDVSIRIIYFVEDLTFATESLGPKYRDPIAIAFNRSGCVHSRKTNVARCKIGNVGINLTKNI